MCKASHKSIQTTVDSRIEWPDFKLTKTETKGEIFCEEISAGVSVAHEEDSEVCEVSLPSLESSSSKCERRSQFRTHSDSREESPEALMLDNSQIDLAETNKDKNFEELEQIKRLLNMSF